LKYSRKIIREYGILKVFIADVKQMQAEDGKQEIIWSGLRAQLKSIPWHTVIPVEVAVSK